MIGISSKGVEVDWKGGVKEGFGQDPPQGLEPMGDSGWYRTPDEPADPTDCDRYPDSPWCGGMPFTRQAVGLDVAPAVSECGFSVTVNPTLGFTKLPPASVAWIAPECRDKYRKVEDVKAPPPASQNYSPPETNWPGGLNDNDEIIAVLGKQEILSNTFYKSYYKRLIYPLVERVEGEGVWSHYSHPGGRSGTSIAAVEGGRTVISADSSGSFPAGDTSGFNTWHLLNEDEGSKYGEDWQFLVSSYSLVIVKGRFGAIKSARSRQDGTINFAPRTFVGGLWYAWWEVFEVIPINLAPDGPPPGFDYRKRKCDCMQCCSPNPFQAHREQQDNAEILALLRQINRKLGNYPQKVQIFDANEDKKGAQTKTVNIPTVAEGLKLATERTEKVSKIVGIDVFPIKAPKSIVEPAQKGFLDGVFDFLNPFDNEELNSVAEFNEWQFRQLTTILGHWQEYVEVEDADATKAGNQKEKVVLPNMSMTLKELYLINTHNLKATGMVLDMCVKLLLECAGIKLATAKTFMTARDIQEFLDYPTNEDTEKVPIQITVPSTDQTREQQNNLKKFLENSEAVVKFDNWTGEGSLHDMLIDLLQVAAAQRAQLFNNNG